MVISVIEQHRRNGIYRYGIGGREDEEIFNCFNRMVRTPDFRFSCGFGIF